MVKLTKSWDERKGWADRFIPQVCEIIRSVAGKIITISPSEEEKDCQEATDFIIKVTAGDIACRIRRYKYWRDYKDVTIRLSLPSKGRTEWDKLKEGYGDWYLYVWLNEDEDEIFAWVLLDLEKMRNAGLFYAVEFGRVVPNVDGTSFTSFDLKTLANSGCIVEMNNEVRNEITEEIKLADLY